MLTALAVAAVAALLLEGLALAAVILGGRRERTYTAAEVDERGRCL